MDGLREKLAAIRDRLLVGLVERDVPVRLALLAAVAGEHLLLIGPPGTAKSQLARRLHLAFDNAPYFERLLTRFSVPEELFGPLSIKELENDRYVRHTEKYLPTASVAFIDEIFKANSAILNSLLTLLNEREFDNGDTRVKTPLICVVGASNELPEGGELTALYDRFLIRYALRGDKRPEIDLKLKLKTGELEAVRSKVEEVSVPEDVCGLLRDLRRHLADKQIQVSDRRWRKIVHLLQTSAYTNGRDEVSVWDGWLLQHCAWEEPDQREVIYEWYESRLGTRSVVDPTRLARLVGTWEKKLAEEGDSRSQARDGKGRKLYRGGDGKPTTSQEIQQKCNEEGEPLYLAPSQRVNDRTDGGKGYTKHRVEEMFRGQVYDWEDNLKTYLDTPDSRLLESAPVPYLEATRYSQHHVDGRVREMDSLLKDASDYSIGLDSEIEELHGTITGHVWLDPSFAEPAARTLTETRGRVEDLRKRLKLLRDGFNGLPREREAVG